jgi:hypothetical protein
MDDAQWTVLNEGVPNEGVPNEGMLDEGMLHEGMPDVQGGPLRGVS